MTMARISGPKASSVVVLFVVISVALSITRSNAFVSPPSIVNFALPNQQLQQTYVEGYDRSIGNGRSSPLYASTASGSGLDVIDSWKLLPDGRIQGVISGSGDKVLTSPLKRKRGLKEASTVRTVSGSRYKLGTPATADGGDKMSPAQMGTPRATVAGVNLPGGFNGRATQPLRSTPTASQDRVLNDYVANKGRATMPVGSSDSTGSDSNEKKKIKFLVPFVGGASALAVGAAIGSGVVSDKGVNLDKLPDASKVLESTKSLGLPDIKSLKAPAIPSPGISLPKFEGVPSLPTPKLPEIGMKLPDVKLPDVKFPEVKLPDGPKLPNLPSVNINVADGVKNLGDAAGGAIGGALESTGIKLPESPLSNKPKAPPSVGMGPYKVPMPYLDEKIVQARKEAAAKEEAERIAKVKAEEEARQKAADELLAQQAREREQAMKMRAEEEARIRQEAEERIQKAEQEKALLDAEAKKEAAILRAEVEKSKAEIEKTKAEVEKARQDALEKEKAAAEEAARLKKEADAALLKEQVARDEFTLKLQAAEMAQLKQAKDFAAKLEEAQEAAAKERALAVESAAAEKLAEEAAVKEAAAIAQVRKMSIGANAARKATYEQPSMSTYEEWQNRQKLAYQARIKEAASGMSKQEAVVLSTTSPSSQDNLSTYKRWQQRVVAKQVVSMSAEPVTAAFVTGAPAPLSNQLVSGSTKLSDFATTLNGALGYTIAGSSALIAGLTYGYSYQKLQDELASVEETAPPATTRSTSPPVTSSVTVKPPPISKKVSPQPTTTSPAPVQSKPESTTSVTMAIDAKPDDDKIASITKEVSSRPATTSTSVTTEVASPPPVASSSPQVNNNGGSYLESMSSVSTDKPSLKTSYSPFSNSKKAVSNNSLYDPPLSKSAEMEEINEEPCAPEFPETSQVGASYLESMSGGNDGLKESYSPFGTPKVAANDSLYGPPVVKEAQSKIEVAPVVDEANDFNEVDESPVNGGSYFDSLSTNGGSGESSSKASYSPFGGTKSWQTTSDSLYDVPVTVNADTTTSEASTADIPTAANSSRGSYLNGLSDDSNSPSVVKKSYSPFGTKPKAVRDGGLYSPGTIHETSKYDAPESKYDLPFESERDAIPVSNYLDRLLISITSKTSSIKKSFSPFGNGKPKAPDNDSLYRAPALDVSLPSEDERDTIPVSNYLQRLIVPLSGSSNSKKSFSPFGLERGKKPKANTSKSASLYSPPNQESTPSHELPSEEERDATPVADYLDRLIVPVSPTSASIKKSYSPFGSTGGKPKASRNDSLYGPPNVELAPSHELPSEEERDATPVADYLDRLIVPVSPTSASIKKSYSPFGSTREKSKSPLTSGCDSLDETPASSNNGLPSEGERDTTQVANSSEPPSEVSTSMITDFIFDTPPHDHDALYEEPSTDVAYAAIDDTTTIVNNDTDQETSGEQKDVSNYLQALSHIASPLKSSYSPFGSWKKERFLSSNSALYQPPESLMSLDSIQTSRVAEDLKEDTESPNTPSKDAVNGNFLESHGGSVSPFVENSCSSRESLPSESATNSLYSSLRDVGDNTEVTSENNRIKKAYMEWCTFYNKESSDLRFDIFSAHFKAVEKFHKENGAGLMLNEFSDLTEEEYKATTNTNADQSIFESVIDGRIVSAYRQWCDWYQKDYSEERLQIFSSNFLILERYHGGEGDPSPLVFNEYSDLTEEEYNELNDTK